MDEKNTIQITTEMHSVFVGDVCAIVEDGRHEAYSVVNSAMTETYWKVSAHRIGRAERQGESRIWRAAHQPPTRVNHGIGAWSCLCEVPAADTHRCQGYFTDLVFYNVILKCYVLIDQKLV